MGPHSTECGNPGRVCLARYRHARLQWGRTQLSAEITLPRADCARPHELQWGRTQLSAEITDGSDAGVSVVSFNGAALN